MRLIIRHQTPKDGLTLPINYHHILQAIIYDHLRVTDYERLHDKAYSYGKRQYRMFTFSEIFGKYRIREKKITFQGLMSYKISSPDEEMISVLCDAFQNRGVSYGDVQINEIEVISDTTRIEANEADIRMISPICIYSTKKNTGEKIYYEPGDGEFEKQLVNNFARKYKAFYGKDPMELPVIEPRIVLPRDRKVTKYQGTMLTAWMGQYRLKGEKDLLNFWMDAGIGGKNAQGFGMFDLV